VWNEEEKTVQQRSATHAVGESQFLSPEEQKKKRPTMKHFFVRSIFFQERGKNLADNNT